jgi:hypothetical protein
MSFTRKTVGLTVLGLVAAGVTVKLILDYVRQQQANNVPPPLPQLVRQNAGIYRQGFFGPQFVTAETPAERRNRKNMENIMATML